MLRSLDWIEDYGAHVGGSVFLDMPEMGACGLAEVLAIEPCPATEPDDRSGRMKGEGGSQHNGEGRLVTGTFRHTSGEVYDLKLACESKPIGVTATHPFWSVDRNAWVSAINLEIGETLKTLTGTTVVQSRSRREEPETVYNIEVEGDHCYRVGESGVLVHNASAPAPGSCCDPPLEDSNAEHGKRYSSSTLISNLLAGNYGPQDGPRSAVTLPCESCRSAPRCRGDPGWHTIIVGYTVQCVYRNQRRSQWRFPTEVEQLGSQSSRPYIPQLYTKERIPRTG